MNFFKKIFTKSSLVSKKAKDKLEEHNFLTLIDSLPSELSPSVIYTKYGSHFHFSNWEPFPDFRFATCRLSEESIKTFSDRKINKRVSGINIYSKTSGEFVTVELLIHNNFISGIKTRDNDIACLDMNQINLSEIRITEFQFPDEFIDMLYKQLPKHIQDQIDRDSMIEIPLRNKTFYTFLDLEDGNYFAIDKNQKVYSLVHDVIPNSKLINYSLEEILNEISTGKFDIEFHLNERYKNST